MKITKKTVISSLKWKFFERISSQIVTFFITLILARILTPGDYGVIAILTVFINIATVFVQGGFNTALIQGEEITDKDYSSVLYFSLIVAGVIYVVLFLTAPFIAQFYSQKILISMTRVLALILFLGAFNSVQVAYVTRELQFKVLFNCNFLSNLVSGIIGIILAILGAGAWALVVQQIFYQLFVCIMMLFCTQWRPTLYCSLKHIKKLISFGGRILASNLLVTLFLNIRSLLVGKIYSSEELGYFDKGKQFPRTLMDALNGTIQTVMLPVYSHEQNNINLIKQMVRKSIQISCYVVFPMMIGLVCVAKPLIQILLTDKWAMAIPIVQIFAFTYMCQPIQTISAQAIKAIGNSKKILQLEMIRKTIELSLLIISLPFGINVIALSSMVSGILSCIISVQPNRKLLGYNYKEQLYDIGIPFLFSICMGVIVWWIGVFIKCNIIKICIQVILGTGIYLGLSIISRNKIFLYLFSCLKEFKTEILK